MDSLSRNSHKREILDHLEHNPEALNDKKIQILYTNKTITLFQKALMPFSKKYRHKTRDKTVHKYVIQTINEDIKNQPARIKQLFDEILKNESEITPNLISRYKETIIFDSFNLPSVKKKLAKHFDDKNQVIILKHAFAYANSRVNNPTSANDIYTHIEHHLQLAYLIKKLPFPLRKGFELGTDSQIANFLSSNKETELSIRIINQIIKPTGLFNIKAIPDQNPDRIEYISTCLRYIDLESHYNNIIDPLAETIIKTPKLPIKELFQLIPSASKQLKEPERNILCKIPIPSDLTTLKQALFLSFKYLNKEKTNYKEQILERIKIYESKYIGLMEYQNNEIVMTSFLGMLIDQSNIKPHEGFKIIQSYINEQFAKDSDIVESYVAELTNPSINEYTMSALMGINVFLNTNKSEDEILSREAGLKIINKWNDIYLHYPSQTAHQILRSIPKNNSIIDKVSYVEYKLLNESEKYQTLLNQEQFFEKTNNLRKKLLNNELTQVVSISKFKEKLDIENLSDKDLKALFKNLNLNTTLFIDEDQNIQCNISQLDISRILTLQSMGQNIIQNMSNSPFYSTITSAENIASEPLINLMRLHPDQFIDTSKTAYVRSFLNQWTSYVSNSQNYLVQLEDKIENLYAGEHFNISKEDFFYSIVQTLALHPSNDIISNLKSFLNNENSLQTSLKNLISTDNKLNQSALYQQSKIQALIHNIDTSQHLQILEESLDRSDILINRLSENVHSSKIDAEKQWIRNLYFHPLLIDLDDSGRELFYNMVDSNIQATFNKSIEIEKIKNSINTKYSHSVEFFKMYMTPNSDPPFSIESLITALHTNVLDYKTFQMQDFNFILNNILKEACLSDTLENPLMKKIQPNLLITYMEEVSDKYRDSEYSSKTESYTSEMMQGLEFILSNISLSLEYKYEEILTSIINCIRDEPNFKNHLIQLSREKDIQSYACTCISEVINESIAYNNSRYMQISNSPFMLNTINTTFEAIEKSPYLWIDEPKPNAQEFTINLIREIESFVSIKYQHSTCITQEAIVGLTMESLLYHQDLELHCTNDVANYICDVIESIHLLYESGITKMLIQNLGSNAKLNDINQWHDQLFQILVGTKAGERSTAHMIHSFLSASPMESFDENSKEEINKILSNILTDTTLNARLFSFDYLRKPINEALDNEVNHIKKILYTLSSKYPEHTKNNLPKDTQSRLRSFERPFAQNSKLKTLSYTVGAIFNGSDLDSSFKPSPSLTQKVKNKIKNTTLYMIESLSEDNIETMNQYSGMILDTMLNTAIKKGIKSFMENFNYWLSETDQQALYDLISSKASEISKEVYKENSEELALIMKLFLQHKTLNSDEIEYCSELCSTLIRAFSNKIFVICCFVDSSNSESSFKLANKLIDKGENIPLFKTFHGIQFPEDPSNIDTPNIDSTLFSHLKRYYTLSADQSNPKKLEKISVKLLNGMTKSNKRNKKSNEKLSKAIYNCKGLIKESFNLNISLEDNPNKQESIPSIIKNFTIPMGKEPHPTLDELFSDTPTNNLANSLQILLKNVSFEKSADKLQGVFDLAKELAMPSINRKFKAIISNEQKKPIYKSTKDPLVKTVELFQSHGKNIFIAFFMNFARILIKHTDWNKNKLLRKLVCKEVSKRSIDIIKSKLKENISKCEVNIQRLTSEIKESTRNTNSTSNNIDDELSKLIIELKDTQNALEKSKRSLEVFQIYKKDLQYIIKNFVPNLLTIFEKEVPNGKPSLKTELLNLLKDIDSFTYKKSKKHTAESITASFNRFSNHLYDTFSTSIVNDVIYGSVINDESE